LGSIEPQFYALMLKAVGVDDPDFAAQHDTARWPALKDKLAAVIAKKSRSEWCALMEASDACFAPVLSLSEVPSHPYHVERKTFVAVDGIAQPAPAPRFSKTPGHVQGGTAAIGEHNDEALTDWGIGAAQIAALKAAGAL
jgi:alpha-methylacyl-CoA racemase